MSSQYIDSIKTLFNSRLETLEHLINTGQEHFSDESFLQERLAPDMFPFGTQIACICNQPHNFALWCDGQPMGNLDLEVTSLSQAFEQIANTKQVLAGISAEDVRLTDDACLDLGEGINIELTGLSYVNEFLIPNFYFHLVTAYDILRMAGVAIGKEDYMMHLVPFVRQE